MFADGEVTAPVYDAGEQLISVPDVCLSSSSQASSQEQLQWHINSTNVARNDTEHSGGRCWVVQSDGASLCPELQELYTFTWGDDEQGAEVNADSQSDFEVEPMTFEQNMADNKDTHLKLPRDYRVDSSSDMAPGFGRNEIKEEENEEYSQPQLSKVAESPVEDTRSLPPAASSTSSSSSVTASSSKVLDAISRRVQQVQPGPILHVVKYVKREGRTIKIWLCAFCKREFQHQYTLMRHLPTHTDERNFHCSTCDKSFRQRSTLSQHRTTHSSARPFACEICKKMFNRVSTLISHRKTHSGNKPYKCSVCPKGFYQKGNLRNHMFTHTNERPYHCPYCDKGFNQQSNLVCHKTKVHRDEKNFRSMFSPLPNPTLHASVNSTRKSNESNRPSTSQHKVSSTIYMKDEPMESMESTSAHQDESISSNFNLSDWPFDESSGEPMHQEHIPVGIIVDSIKTFQMEMALATNQTPFALLRPEFGSPMLVKVVDTQLDGGKQLLVPATAEDLRIGGKVVKEEDKEQIRVPVVATVIQRMQSSGQVILSVEEPHASPVPSTDVSTSALPVNTSVEGKTVDFSSDMGSNICVMRDSDSRLIRCSKDPVFGHHYGPSAVHLTASPPPPPPSPAPIVSPCRGLDLFDPTDCMPMGPQITAVEANEVTPTDEPDIFMQMSQFPVDDGDSKLMRLNI